MLISNSLHCHLSRIWLCRPMRSVRIANWGKPLSYSRNLQDEEWSHFSLNQLKLNDIKGFEPLPLHYRRVLRIYTKCHFSAIDGLAPSTSWIQIRTLLLELYCILKNTRQSVHGSRFHFLVLRRLLLASRGMAGLLECKRSVPLIRIAGSTVKPL